MLCSSLSSIKKINDGLKYLGWNKVLTPGQPLTKYFLVNHRIVQIAHFNCSSVVIKMINLLDIFESSEEGYEEYDDEGEDDIAEEDEHGYLVVEEMQEKINVLRKELQEREKILATISVGIINQTFNH